MQEMIVEPRTSSGTELSYQAPRITDAVVVAHAFEHMFAVPLSEGKREPYLSDSTARPSAMGESAATTVKETAFIAGPLPDGYHLMLAIPVELWREGSEVVAAQPAMRLHSFGANKDEALENFREILVEQLQRLEGYEARLSQPMEDDLNLLRALVRRDG